MTMKTRATGKMVSPGFKGDMMFHRAKSNAISKLRELCQLFLLVFALAAAANAQPTFTKVFAPSTIGPGSVSMLTFTIDNTASGSPVTDLAFTDVLPTVPGDVDISDPAIASTDCPGGAVTAPAGGGTISFTDGKLGAGESCTVMVQVTASTPGLHPNTSGDLTSSAGNSGTATDDLTVATTLPGFSKSFAPSSVSLGGRSTLTFTIDNTLNASRVGNLDFVDTFPVGMAVADPPNAFTDCVSASVPDTTITAVPGTNVVSLNADGSNLFPGFEVLPIGATCTVTVDVIGSGAGVLDNLSGELLADFVASGKAAATLTVTQTTLSLIKSFTDDPVPPGGTAELEFKIENFDRLDSATGVGFDDVLVGVLPGLEFDSLLANDCGGSVSGVGTTTIGFSGGSLAPETACTIRVSLTVPPGAAPGAYTNTTTPVTGTIGGSPVTGNMASETLFVEPIPLLTKEFLDAMTLLPDPVVNPGGDVVLRFTINNTSTTSGATDVAFVDELTTFLPFPLSVTLPPTPNPPCGAGSALGFVFPDVDRQGLSLTAGTLAAAGMPGDSCAFDVTITLPAGLAPGNFVNTTEEITATVDGATRTGRPASDNLVVLAAPSLQKSFTDDPVAPGGTVTMEFTLTHSLNLTGPATDITFTDDLAAAAFMLPGATANLPSSPDPPCGVGSTLVGTMGDTLLTLSGGTLTNPGDSCTFSVTLNVPAGAAAGSHTNTTSLVSATVEGVTATSQEASDVLDVSGLIFTKQFLTNPIIPGDTTTLRFTIDNVHPTDDATIIFFVDNLQANLTGLAATGPPSMDTCGGALSGTTSLTYVGGGVMSGTSCTIEVPVLVPPGAADGNYLNVSSSLSTSLGTINPATDSLTVSSNLLFLTKEFTDDPILPGGTGTLEFTLTNLDGFQGASGIDFSDDLDATLSGLEWTASLFNDCGGTAGGFGPTFAYTGGTLGMGGSCTIRITISDTLTSPPGAYPNTTSGVTGTIAGFPVVGDPASDDLNIGALSFSKSFSADPEPGDTVTLTFSINNASGVVQSDLGFTDDLDAVLTNLAPVLPLPTDPCGLGSSITVSAAPATLALTAGTVAAGGSCTVMVDVVVPAGTSLGSYPNTTSDLQQLVVPIGGVPVAPPATAALVVTTIITNAATATALGAMPATDTTIDTVQP